MQLLLFSGLSITSISVFGACEAELNKKIQACTYCTASQIEGFKRGHQMLQGDPWSEGKIADLEHFMKESQQNVNRTGGTYAPHIVNLYSAEHQMCFVRRQEGKDSVNPSSNSSTVEATSPQSNSDTPHTRKLSAALKRIQDAQQKAEEQINQSQQLAQETQAKAGAARQGKRKIHDPSAEATNCMQPIQGNKEDRIKNICNFEIYYTFCYYQPEEGSSATFTTCEKQSFGAVQLKPGKSHVVYKRAEKFYWHACKLPTWSVET